MTIVNLSQLEKILNIQFKDKNLLAQALTHRSYLNEASEKNINSNERLEFLGDAVLSFWASDQIYKKFPGFPEGKLTFIRTYLVRTTTLTLLSQKLSLGKYLYLSKGEETSGGRENNALLANSFEALLGAIYIDQGVTIASKFLEKQFETLISSALDPEKLKDGKSLLQEKVQSEGHSSPEYRLTSSCGPDHKKTFTMAVFVDGKEIAQGVSKSKQEAEEIAAEKALEILS